MMKNQRRNILLAAVLSIGVLFTVGYAETNALSSENQPVAAPTETAATTPASAPAPAATESVQPASSTSTTTAATATTTAAAQPATENTPAASEQDDRKVVARVVWVKGKFNASKPGSTDTRELKTAATVYMNDTLTTEANSEAQIIFTDNSSMTFRPDTKLYINEYNYQPKTEVKKGEKKSAGRYILDLVTGGFRTVTGMVAKENPNDYAVNTPVATIGVRGTEYSLVYKQGQDLYIKRYAGEPCMANSATKKGDTSKGIIEKSNVGGGGAAASGQNNEVCLNEAQQYGYVQSNDLPPAVLMRQPEVFRTDVEIIPVSFKQSGSFGGTVGPGQSGNSNNQGNSGSSSGFCIQ